MVSKCYYHSSNDGQSTADYSFSKERPVTDFNHYSPSSIGIQRRATPNVEARFSATATVIDQNIYIIGGQTASDNTKNAIAHDIIKVEYSSLNVTQQNIKFTVRGHGAIPVGSKILLFFGQQSLTPQQLAAPIQQLDPTTGEITNVQTKGNIPASRFDHSVTVVNKKAYIIGGTNVKGAVLKDVSYFDMDKNTWNTLDATKFPDNAAISGHATIAINNFLVSCFGLDAKNVLRADCTIFDTEKNDFVQADISGTAPTPRSAASMIVGNSTSNILVFGGINTKNNAAFNDVFVLDASKAPTLIWQQVQAGAKNKTFIPSARGEHIAAAIDNKVMMIWGGVQKDKIMADTSIYYYDIKNNTWVDDVEVKSVFAPNAVGSTSNDNANNGVAGGILAAVIAIIILVALVGLCIIRRRRLRQNASFDRAASRDPYIRPGGQLNESFSDLSLNENTGWYMGETANIKNGMMHNNVESKGSHLYGGTRRPSTTSADSEKRMIYHAEEMARSLPSMPIAPNVNPKPDSLPPMPSLTPDPVPMPDALPVMPTITPNPSPAALNISVPKAGTLPPTPTSMSAPSPVSYNSPLSSPRSNRSSSESSQMKKGHRRTSSVSLTPADLPYHVFPKPPFRNSITSTRSQKAFHRPRSSLSQVINLDAEEMDYESSINHSKKPSIQSNASEVIRSPPKSPLSPPHSLSQGEEHSSMPMEYYNTDDYSSVNPAFNAENLEDIQSERHSYSGNFLDHEEVVAAYGGQRRRSESFCFPPRDDIERPSEDVERDQPYGHERTVSNDRLQTIRESDVLDSYTRDLHESDEVQNSVDPFMSSDEKRKLAKKKKRSSGRVSFATVHEKIEFDESESSQSVSLANSMISAIHEDNINGYTNFADGENSETISNSRDSDSSLRPLQLYEEDGEHGGSRISRFSFSVYDFTTDDNPMPSNATEMIANVQTQRVEEYHPPSPVRRTESPDIRNSIAEAALDGGVLYALI